MIKNEGHGELFHRVNVVLALASDIHYLCSLKES